MSAFVFNSEYESADAAHEEDRGRERKGPSPAATWPASSGGSTGLSTLRVVLCEGKTVTPSRLA